MTTDTSEKALKALIREGLKGKLDGREAAAQIPDESERDYRMEESHPVGADGLDDASYNPYESPLEEKAMESEVRA